MIATTVKRRCQKCHWTAEELHVGDEIPFVYAQAAKTRHPGRKAKPCPRCGGAVRTTVLVNGQEFLSF
ncbi:hypothetical protein [Caldinitratiruptor microaerophilus]|uniref:Uncharacterized protein n=1 Tax=Caldinitratiruptor microaerophilus TaxID=671077 RepID=A0AA35CIY8_9FIRM|nr:hypothetical protein [Caldinitratiruptor microaerophilus]BDG59917.1 hypothetical protein caldi_10070 [Caldinitratiruptor microaerophilus]